MIKSQISEFVKDAHSLRLFEQERIILDVTERICEVMDANNLNRVQLATSLGKSKGYISQLLDGSANMTLRTMSDVFLALGLRACVRTEPLHRCKEHRLTLVHDDEPSVRDWGTSWEQAAEQFVPQSVPGVSGEPEVMVA
ncbi:MAG: helix-turn-helix transcriptional regulator [Planctomycetes bacterium]|nr:helix-turn-helix transcriptional regulator [Planctomycetota bacterium]